MKSRREKGAVLVAVALAVVALLGFSALVVDYGVMWVGRRQTQNAVDAGALAGAIQLGFYGSSDYDAARAAAVAAATGHQVWGASPSVTTGDVFIEACPPTPGWPSDTCIRVDGYRNQERSNALPMFFGRVLGLTAQGVKATATARVMSGGSRAECLKPWFIPDKWREYQPVEAPWDPEASYDTWTKKGNDWIKTCTTGPCDAPYYGRQGFQAPFDQGWGPTASPENDTGWVITLKKGDMNDALKPGWVFPMELLGTGGDDYNTAIVQCVDDFVSYVPRTVAPPEQLTEQAIQTECDPTTETWCAEGEMGVMTGPTFLGLEALLAKYPDNATAVSWDFGTNTCEVVGEGGALVPVPTFNVEEFYLRRQQGGQGSGANYRLRITGILGFYLHPANRDNRKEVIGCLAPIRGEPDPNSGPSSFLRFVTLVR